MKERFYSPKEIEEITGYKYGKCCDLIRNLNKKLAKEYPGTITLRGRVPAWYFEKKVMLKESTQKGCLNEISNQSQSICK